MRAKAFAAWAAAHGLPIDHVEKLVRSAATEREMKAAADAMDPAPPVYTLKDIVEMTDRDPYGIHPLANGFILIGGCPNGDPVAVDVADERGSVWYISHEQMHDAPRLRDVAVRVATDVRVLVDRIGDGRSPRFPLDYQDATD